MVRTKVHFTEAQVAFLKQEAASRNISVAEVVRQIIDTLMRPSDTGGTAQVKSVGLGNVAGATKKQRTAMKPLLKLRGTFRHMLTATQLSRMRAQQ